MPAKLCVLALIGLALTGPVWAGDLDARLMRRLTPRAQAGDVEAQLDLAGLYARAGDARAGNAYRRAAASGDGEALFLYGLALRDGQYGLTADWNDGMSLLQRAANQGNGNAVCALDYSQVDDYDRPRDPAYNPPEPGAGTERLRWDLCQAPHLSSLPDMTANDAEIADLTRAGYGAHIGDWRLDVFLARDAAEDGDASAIQTLGDDLLSGHGVAANASEAERWFQILADDGVIDHQLTVAAHYDAGDFGPARGNMALIYYRRAGDALRAQAMAGDIAASQRLGQLYETGKLGADDSDAQALSWYNQAATRGNLDAEAGLGRLYLQGRGTPADTHLGIFWLSSAADNNDQRLKNAGDADAIAAYQRELGQIYLDGRWLPRDDYLAAYWFGLAIDNTQGEISQESADLSSDMTNKALEAQAHLSSDQIGQMHRAVDAWHDRLDPPEH